MPVSTDKDSPLFVDVFCQDNKGNKFIIEMQKAPQRYFIHRAHMYTSQLLSKYYNEYDGTVDTGQLFTKLDNEFIKEVQYIFFIGILDSLINEDYGDVFHSFDVICKNSDLNKLVNK